MPLRKSELQGVSYLVTEVEWHRFVETEFYVFFLSVTGKIGVTEVSRPLWEVTKRLMLMTSTLSPNPTP